MISMVIFSFTQRLSTKEFLTFYINPWCRDFIAVHEDEGMVQRILLIDAEYPSN